MLSVLKIEPDMLNNSSHVMNKRRIKRKMS